jgi:regulatory protein
MPNVITALQLQKQNKERVNVFLDGKYAFAVQLMLAAGLQKGQQLTPAEIEALQNEDEQQRAYASALHFLGHRPRSAAEVKEHLQAKQLPPMTIAYVIQRLADEKYVDDEAFAQYWRENRERFRPRGARALRYELRQKGIEKTVIDDALGGMDEEAGAWAALEPKLARWATLDKAAFASKVFGHLARRGFSHEVARSVTKRAWAALGKQGDLLDDE